MGAVWGFTGPPDKRIAACMTGALTHRGGLQVHQNVGSTASIHLREPHANWCIGLVPPALHDFPEYDLTIALCGWVNSIDDPERVKQLLSYDIEEGRGRYGLRLWMLITFELWRRIVVDGEPV